jgi:hypothetical protein
MRPLHCKATKTHRHSLLPFARRASQATGTTRFFPANNQNKPPDTTPNSQTVKQTNSQTNTRAHSDTHSAHTPVIQPRTRLLQAAERFTGKTSCGWQRGPSPHTPALIPTSAGRYRERPEWNPWQRPEQGSALRRRHPSSCPPPRQFTCASTRSSAYTQARWSISVPGVP